MNRRIVVATIAAVAMVIAGISGDHVAQGAPAGPDKLTSAEKVACVPVRSKPQTFTMARTGGVTAILSVAAFPASATGCARVRVGTGDNIDPVDGLTAPGVVSGLVMGRGFQAPSTNASPTPLLTVTIGDDTDATTALGSTWVVTGTKLKLDANLRFPNGTYYATLNAEGPGSRSILVPFVARNGVLTVAPADGLEGKAFPITIVAKSRATLSLFAKGVRPPVRAQGDIEPETTIVATTTNPGRRVTTIPPEPPHAKAMKGDFGQPPPTGIVGSVSWDWIGCTTIPEICSWTREVFMNGSEAIVDVPSGLVGTMSWSYNLAYMGIQTVTVTACPIDWAVSANVGGGTITFPANMPAGSPQKKPGCQIVLSTLPKGKSGTYYAVEVRFRWFATGG